MKPGHPDRPAGTFHTYARREIQTFIAADACMHACIHKYMEVLLRKNN